MIRNHIINEKIQNRFHTIVLLVSMAGLLGAIGWLFAGVPGLSLALAAAVFGAIFTPRMSSAFIMRFYQARPVYPHQLPGLYTLLRRLAAKAGLKKTPRLYYSSKNILNAFAAGSKDDPAICITHGLLSTLSTEQMAGILGHEIAHIKNNDMAVMTLASLFNRLTGFLSNMGLLLVMFFLPLYLVGNTSIPYAAVILMLFAPVIGILLQLALSRTREFEADLECSLLLGSPYPLAAALQTLEESKRNNWASFFTAGPLPQQSEIFSSHPDTRERIRRLVNLTDPFHNAAKKPFRVRRSGFTPMDSVY